MPHSVQAAPDLTSSPFHHPLVKAAILPPPGRDGIGGRGEQGHVKGASRRYAIGLRPTLDAWEPVA